MVSVEDFLATPAENAEQAEDAEQAIVQVYAPESRLRAGTTYTQRG